MNNRLIDLFPHEREALLEALRRDLRVELAKCENDPIWADIHQFNVTRNVRLLEAINPKRKTLRENRFVASEEMPTTYVKANQYCVEEVDFFQTDLDDRIPTESTGGLQRNLRNE
jgi:hypothetical protein